MNKLNLNNIIFESDVIFKHVEFRDSVFFNNCIFRGNADFSKSTFKQQTEYVDTDFLFSDFSDVVFEEDVYFSDATFGKNAIFDYSEFMSNACFHRAIMKNVSFKNSNFRDNAEFNATEISNIFSLEGTTCEKTVDFRDTVFSHKNGNSAIVILQGATYNLMRINWYQVNENLFIADGRGKHNFNQYVKLDSVTFQPISNILVQMEDNFRKLGQAIDEDLCYYYRKQLERQKAPWFLEKFKYLILELTCGYGVKPFYTIRCSALVIIICGL